MTKSSIWLYDFFFFAKEPNHMPQGATYLQNQEYSPMIQSSQSRKRYPSSQTCQINLSRLSPSLPLPPAAITFHNDQAFRGDFLPPNPDGKHKRFISVVRRRIFCFQLRVCPLVLRLWGWERYCRFVLVACVRDVGCFGDEF